LDYLQKCLIFGFVFSKKSCTFAFDFLNNLMILGYEK